MQRETSKEQDPEKWWRGADKIFFSSEHQNQPGYRTSLPQAGFPSSLKHSLFYGPVSEGLMKLGQHFRSPLLEEKPSPALSTWERSTQQRVWQRTIIPWPHLWAQGVWQPTRQNNHQTGQAESQVNPRHWEQLVTEKGSFKTYRDVGIAK